jgi:hypothetical protein
MQFFLFITLIFYFLLSGCASSVAYQQQMKQWRGKNIQVLKNRWGEPDAAIKLADGHTLYQYTRKTFYTIPGSKRQFLQANNNIFTSYDEPWHGNQTRIRYCRTRFETNAHGDIIHINFTGNNCIAFCFH